MNQIFDKKCNFAILMNNVDLSKTLGENGRKRVETNYNWEKNATVMLDIYKEVIRKHNHL